MRLLTDDVADAVHALEELMFARKRDRHDLLPFIVMLAGFERARATLVPVASPSRSMLEDLFAKTQAALALAHAEHARDPQPVNLVALELVALIEALGQRLSALPTLPSPSGDARRKQPVLLVS